MLKSEARAEFATNESWSVSDSSRAGVEDILPMDPRAAADSCLTIASGSDFSAIIRIDSADLSPIWPRENAASCLTKGSGSFMTMSDSIGIDLLLPRVARIHTACTRSY